MIGYTCRAETCSCFYMCDKSCVCVIYLFINSIPKSVYRNSSNGYRDSQRIRNNENENKGEVSRNTTSFFGC
jgi:hypothetical protein